MNEAVSRGVADALSWWSLVIHVGMVGTLLVVNLVLWLSSRREVIRTWVGAWAADAIALGAVLAFIIVQPSPRWFSLYGGAKLVFALLLVRGLLMMKHDRIALPHRSRIWAAAIGVLFGISLLFFGPVTSQALTYLAVGAILVGGGAIAGLRMDRRDVWFLPVATIICGVLFVHHGFVLIPVDDIHRAPLYMSYVSFVDVFGEFLIGLSCLLALGRRALREMAEINQDLQATQKALRALVDADPLTGLYNRRKLRPVFTAATARGGSLVYIDINNFKGINDRWGHLTGDQCLREVADALRTSFRSEDGLFRLGGDEFLVVAPGLDSAEANKRVHRLQQMLEEPGSVVVPIPTAVGVVELDPARAMDDALALADDAMYRNKASRQPN